MKEKIYTIPVNEAFDTECECAVCALEERFEKEQTEYFLGPSLMEPSNREETNRKGFCGRHWETLYNTGKGRLGMSLMLETHLAQQAEKLAKASRGASAASIVSALDEFEKSCTLCAKLAATMERYYDVIFYLWSNDPDFRVKFQSQPGFCLKHYRTLLNAAAKYLPKKELARFTEAISEMENAALQRIRQDLQGFTRKFDYRFADEPWGTSKDAVPRSIAKLRGYRKFD